MSEPLPGLIQQANRRMSRLISTPDLGDHPSTPRALEAIGRLIGRVQSELDRNEAPTDGSLTRLLPEYKSKLTELQSLLQLLDSDLRHRHSELKAEKKRLDSAQSWSSSYRTTV